jgi:hypothetical protein
MQSEGRFVEVSDGAAKGNAPRWGVLRRLEFIDFRLFWTGRLNRSDLSELFGISAPQASSDIALYQEMAPDNLGYDRGQKVYLRLPGFKPAMIDEVVDRFLLQIIAVRRGWLKKTDTWFDELPPLEVVALQTLPTDAAVLQGVLDAIREKAEVEVHYSSMTGSAATRRRIAPHAMASGWGRWYVRAWSAEHNDFRDYALARISSIGDPRPRSVNPVSDLEWQHRIELELVPNPELDPDRRKAQEIEHKMVDGVLKVPCRLSLAFYLMAEHKLDVEAGKLTPFQQPLVLRNLSEVRQRREVAREMAKQALAAAAGA